MMYFFTKAQLEARISAKRVKRIYEDNLDGNADTDPINQLRADTTAKVCSYLEPLGVMAAIEARFNQTTGELLDGKALPQELTRLTLEVAVALASQRFPEVMRMNWVELMAQVDKDLCKLRDGKTSLGGGLDTAGDPTPEVELQGSTVVIADDGSGASDDEREPRWSAMGDFT